MKLKEADSKSFGLLLDRNTVGHTPACQASFRIGTQELVLKLHRTITVLESFVGVSSLDEVIDCSDVLAVFVESCQDLQSNAFNEANKLTTHHAPPQAAAARESFTSRSDGTGAAATTLLPKLLLQSQVSGLGFRELLLTFSSFVQFASLRRPRPRYSSSQAWLDKIWIVVMTVIACAWLETVSK